MNSNGPASAAAIVSGRQVFENHAVARWPSGAAFGAGGCKVGKTVLQCSQLREFLAHMGELQLRYITSLAAVLCGMVHEPNEFADFFDGKGEVPAAPDEGKPLEVALIIKPVSAWTPLRLRKQTYLFIVANRRNAAPCALRQRANS